MIIVSGNICLDIIPHFAAPADFTPGTLLNIGPATVATGGVSNVGVALHRLGVEVKLIHKIGRDFFGKKLLDLLRESSPTLTAGVKAVRGETTSYTLVIAPPNADRMFLHCPGSNDTFVSKDVKKADLQGGTHLHFSYPPIMREVYRDAGQLTKILRRARSAGLTTSLDLCSVDPSSEAGRLDWRPWLAQVLPDVDLFTPSFDELSVMLGLPVFLTVNNVRALADFCRDIGCKSVMIKLGQEGLYYADANEEHHAPCRAVDVATATGSGDCTIAGFLAARDRGDSIEKALSVACGVGAFCCEQPDATSGVPALAVVDRRLSEDWPVLPSQLSFV